MNAVVRARLLAILELRLRDGGAEVDVPQRRRFDLVGVPLAQQPDPRGVAAAPVGRARADPEHQRDGLAGLGDPHRRARGARIRRLSGGGFLFDTGAHMLNTVADLAGEDFAEVAAWLEDDGRPVDIRAAVMGRLASGALVTMNACGSAIPSCHSDIRVFTTGAILRTGIWGETLEIQRSGASALRKVRSVAGIHGLGAVPERPGRAGSRTRARRRSASGWPGCGTRSANPRRAAGAVVRLPASLAARTAASRRGRRSLDDPRDRLERVPPGAVRPAGAPPSTRTGSTRRSPRACARRGSTWGRRPSTSRSTA